MIDPISVPLGAIALLFPIYDACDRLYHGYSLARSFGSDYYLAQFELEMQWCRLDMTSRHHLSDLETPIRTDDPTHPRTQTVIKALALIKTQFELTNKLMKKYAEKEKDHEQPLHSMQKFKSVDTSSSTTNVSSLPASTLASNDVASSSTSVTTHVAANVSQPFKPPRDKGTTAQFKRGLEWAFRHGRFKKDHSQTGQTLTQAHINVRSPTTMTHPPAAQSLLDSSLVTRMEEEQTQNRRALMDHSSFYRRVRWAKSDKNALEKIIRTLKSLNNFVETVLVLRLSQDPVRLLTSTETEEQDESWLPQAKVVQGMLMRLHDSLRHMNIPGNGHKSWRLNVKLANSFEDFRTDTINNLYGQTLRDKQGAYYFTLRRHMQDSLDKATLFVAESMPSQPAKKAHSTVDAGTWHLDLPKSLEDYPDDIFKDWGAVWTGTNSGDVHHLFHSDGQVSYTLGTLPDLLKNKHASKMTPTQRVDLAHLVAISYIHFSLVQQSCNVIRPSSFCYYTTGAHDHAWEDDDLPITKPYLDIGFGQRPPTMLGEGSGISKNQSTLIVGLGLLLFQIGCCMAIPYNMSSQGILEAKRKVSFNLHLLDARVSPAYAEVAQACLQFTPATARKNGASVDKFLEGVVSRLLSLQESLA